MSTPNQDVLLKDLRKFLRELPLGPQMVGEALVDELIHRRPAARFLVRLDHASSSAAPREAPRESAAGRVCDT